jgi:hypothetical protein
LEDVMAKVELEATVKMTKAKETKRTIVFEAENGIGVCNSVYVNKGTGFDDAAAIEVTFTKAK